RRRPPPAWGDPGPGRRRPARRGRRRRGGPVLPVGRTLRPGPGAAATGLVRTGGAPAPPGGRVHAVGGIGGDGGTGAPGEDGGTGAPGEDGGTGAFGPAVTSVVGGDAPRRCSDKALRSDAVSGRADGSQLRRRDRATRWPARPRSVRARARW